MRLRPARRATALAAVGVAAVIVGVLGLLQAYLSRPFWYDEIWRAHVVSEPARSLWAELAVANTPSALGWFGLTRLSGDVFGWHSWALRLPGFVAVPLLGAVIVIVARRFTGVTAAVAAACWVCLNSTFLDLATQLKPYALETLAATAILALWMVDSPSDHAGERASRTYRPSPGSPGLDKGRFVRRAAAGVLALFAVPGIFLIVPLAAVDLWRGPRRRWRLLECSPALVLAGLHTVVFVAHQSSQRNGVYWDRQFLAGRGPLDAIRFVADQLRLTLTGSPPGIDRFDPSLVHGALPLGSLSPWVALLLGLVIAGTGAIGGWTLAGRPDGRLLLAALAGTELMMLAASAGRYWPFGPTRTNAFVVPMLIVVVLVGAERVLRWLVLFLRQQSPGKAPQIDAEGSSAVDPIPTPGSIVISRSLSEFSPLLHAPDGSARPLAPSAAARPGAPAGGRALIAVALVAVALVGLVSSGGLLAGNSLAGSRLLWDHRDRMRGLDLMVDAAIATRRVAGPDDVVAVGGRLARPGWLYAMEASADGSRDPSALPPRISRVETIFFGGSTPPLTAQIAGRASQPRHLIVFVFDIEQRDLSGQLAALTRAGWCTDRSWAFHLTGTLTRYDRCAQDVVSVAAQDARPSQH